MGLSPRPMCSLPSPDAGRPRADSGECEGMCEAELTPAERDAVIQGKRLARMHAAYSGAWLPCARRTRACRGDLVHRSICRSGLA